MLVLWNGFVQCWHRRTAVTGMQTFRGQRYQHISGVKVKHSSNINQRNSHRIDLGAGPRLLMKPRRAVRGAVTARTRAWSMDRTTFAVDRSLALFDALANTLRWPFAVSPAHCWAKSNPSKSQIALSRGSVLLLSQRVLYYLGDRSAALSWGAWLIWSVVLIRRHVES